MDDLLKKTVELCSRIAREIAELSSPPPGRDGDPLVECGLAICGLLERQSIIVLSRTGDFKLLQRRLDGLLSLATDKFYAYPFSDVPECWLRLFTDASIVKSCALLAKPVWAEDGVNGCKHEPSPTLESNMLDEVVKTLDMACIMAGASGSFRDEWIAKLFDLLSRVFESAEQGAQEQAPKGRKRLDETIQARDAFPNSNAFVPPVSRPIERIRAPSFSRFEKHLHQPADPAIGPTPLIIQNAIEHWPARSERPWNRPSYLLSKTLGGRRLVPIEVGRSYVDEGWTQEIVSFGDFMHKYLMTPPPPAPTTPPANSQPTIAPGYLAQHDMFTQIPALRADISVPDYCYVTPPPPPSSSSAPSRPPTHDINPLLNAWLGPANTISPLHTDRFHNILAQIVGRKYVRLYAPAHSRCLYPRPPRDGLDMSNTSTLDVGLLEGWDTDANDESRRRALEKWPLFREAEYCDCVLEEGECLYIPLGWWHYVRSVSVSFNVSFWWR